MADIADIKSKIEKVVEKVKSSKDFASSFKSNPVKAVESVVGKDLPDETINKIVDGVKAKVDIDTISGAASKLGGLFKK